MERWCDKVAVVTGASSGIGAKITKDLITAGLYVVGLARRVERIEALKKEVPENFSKRLTAIKCDVSKYESVKEAFRIIRSIHERGVDVLINNAGCWKIGQLSTMDPALVNSVLQVNVMGIVYCTREAYESLKEHDGHVIIINSVCGHKVIAGAPDQVPVTNIYSPSKHAVACLTEIYRQEFRTMNTKIRITSISPGPTDTEMIPEDFKKIQPSILKTDDISQAVLYALSTPSHVQIHEIIIKPLNDILCTKKALGFDGAYGNILLKAFVSKHKLNRFQIYEKDLEKYFRYFAAEILNTQS